MEAQPSDVGREDVRGLRAGEVAVLGTPASASIVVSAPSRPLRRRLRPLVWVALEEVALDAVAEDGRLVARTSARQVAERLGVDPGTAAGALRALRRRGLLVLEREQGPAGRFGLSVYVLGSVAGLNVVSPGMSAPSVARPLRGEPAMGRPDLGEPVLAVPETDEAYADGWGMAAPELYAPQMGHRGTGASTPSVPAAPPCRGQLPLDLRMEPR